MKNNIFHPNGTICIIYLLSAFKLAYDTNGLYRGAPIWVLHFFVKKQACLPLSSRRELRVKSSRKRQQHGKLTPSCEVVKYYLRTYSTNDVVSEIGSELEIMGFTQPKKVRRWSSKPNYSGPRRYNTIKCTKTTPLMGTSLKAYKTPFSSACVRFGVSTSMQPFKTWCATWLP